jgi:hypothetical protein
MNKSILWGGIALAILIGACLVNISFYHSSYFLLSLVSGVLIGFFVFMAICKFDSITDLASVSDPYYEEQYDKMKENGGSGIIGGLFSMIVAIIIIVTYNNSRENNAFDKEGIIVTGNVINGSEQVTKRTRWGMETGRSSSFKLTIEYKTKDGQERTITESVSSENFNGAYKGQPIELIYYKNDPSMVKLITGSENLKKYKGVEDRAMLGNDIEKILTMPKDSIKTRLLDKLATDWREASTPEYTAFENNTKKEGIIIQGDRVIYITQKYNSDFRKFLAPLQIEKELTPPKELLNEGKKEEKTILTAQDETKVIQTKKFDVIYSMKTSLVNPDEDGSSSNNRSPGLGYRTETVITYIFTKRNLK